MATGLSILAAIPILYALENGGDDITMALVVTPVAIGIVCFHGFLGRLLGIAYSYLIAVPTTFLLAYLFVYGPGH